MDRPSYLDVTLGQFLEQLARRERGPGGGSAAALAVAFAAALVAMTARRSVDSWEEAGGVAAQAGKLVARAAPLAQVDAETWHAALDALAEREREDELARRLADAVEVPLAIAEVAADVASLAALAADRGDGTYRGDAAAAAMLAEAGARAAANLVALNLAVTADDERLKRVRKAEEAARTAAARALDAGP